MVIITTVTSNNERNRNLTGSKAREFLKKPDVFVLDVRTDFEFMTGSLEGARLIPVDQLQNQLDKLPQKKDTPILVYCAHGVRSIYAKTILENFGYTEVFNLTGGLAEFLRNGD